MVFRTELNGIGGTFQPKKDGIQKGKFQNEQTANIGELLSNPKTGSFERLPEKTNFPNTGEIQIGPKTMKLHYPNVFDMEGASVEPLQRNTKIINTGGIDLKDMIPLDSDLGQKITERRDELAQQRQRGTGYRVNRETLQPETNEYDKYVPIYEVDMDSPRCDQKIIGYRLKTEEEQSGNILK